MLWCSWSPAIMSYTLNWLKIIFYLKPLLKSERTFSISLHYLSCIALAEPYLVCPMKPLSSRISPRIPDNNQSTTATSCMVQKKPQNPQTVHRIIMRPCTKFQDLQ